MGFEMGEFVTASYKSGRYIGKVIDVKPDLQKAVVEIRAVLVHPRQGDLHAPNKTDGVFFHERKALAYTEKALVPVSSMKRFEGDIPSYKDSLLESVEKQLTSFKMEESDFAQLAVERLQTLKREYERMEN